jgi:catechol 2,3-dioxygenase-like lactoylglutathione lyase family enzyme
MISGGNATAAVTDLGRAVRFYVETLGMKLVAASETFATVDAGSGFVIGLHAAPVKGEGEQRRPPISIGLHVKGRLEDVVAVLENRGIEFRVKADPRVKLASFADPDGNPLYLFEELGVREELAGPDVKA